MRAHQEHNCAGGDVDSAGSAPSTHESDDKEHEVPGDGVRGECEAHVRAAAQG